jgi:hypothetical protein
VNLLLSSHKKTEEKSEAKWFRARNQQGSSRINRWQTRDTTRNGRPARRLQKLRMMMPGALFLL